MPGQSARAGADDRGAEERGWEHDPDQRADPGPVHAPCWVGFSVFVTRTLPSSSLRITAESNVPIAPGGVEVEHGLIVGLGVSDLVVEAA